MDMTQVQLMTLLRESPVSIALVDGVYSVNGFANVNLEQAIDEAYTDSLKNHDDL